MNYYVFKIHTLVFVRYKSFKNIFFCLNCHYELIYKTLCISRQIGSFIISPPQKKQTKVKVLKFVF